MELDDLQYYAAWLTALKPNDPQKLWAQFVAQPQQPTLTFAFAASAVYSSNIEGNTLDLNAFMRSKANPQGRLFKAKEQVEIEALIAAYRFARTHILNEKNALSAHRLLAKPLLPQSQRGRYRNQRIFVYSQRGIEYAALEPEQVPAQMQIVFAAVRRLQKSALPQRRVFYHAALLHLVVAHIHPFHDGNGRMARLLEKWFLATQLGAMAWRVPTEQYYKEQRDTYYQRINLGMNYYELHYERCVPFLTMLAQALKT